MARTGYNRGDSRPQRQRYGYVDGNTVRQPGRIERPVPRRQERETRVLSSRTRRNRAREAQMSFGYVAFLALVSVVTLLTCVNYLQLQAQNITYRNQVAVKESQLNDLKIENDTAYENALTSVDLQKIRDIAVNKLGMIYAEEGQIRTYSSQNGDYVRQYENVPTE